MQHAIFLDRDGTLNVDKGYVHKIEDWQWLPGAFDALLKFKSAGWYIVIVSNQSGIGRGYYGEEQLHKLEKWVDSQFTAKVVDSWRHCPHLPETNCNCRKPMPGMIINAAKELDIEIKSSWMIGDRVGDVQAGLTAGCMAGFVKNSVYHDDIAIISSQYPAVPIWKNLYEAACNICR